VAQEVVVVHHLDVEVVEELSTGQAGGLHGADLRGRVLGHVGRVPGPQAVGAAQVHLVATLLELGSEVTHRGDHQMGLLHVPTTLRELGGADHQQHPCVRGAAAAQVRQVHVELVAPDPHRAHEPSSC